MDLFNKVHIFEPMKSHIYEPNISLISLIILMFNYAKPQLSLHTAALRKFIRWHPGVSVRKSEAHFFDKKSPK